MVFFTNFERLNSIDERQKKFFLVDDEQDILEILSYNLEKKVTKFYH